MSFRQMLDQVVDVVRDLNYIDGDPDVYGDVVPEWATVAASIPAAFWPLRRKLVSRQGGETPDGAVGGYLEAGVPVRQGDVLIVTGGTHAGDAFRVQGPPMKLTSRRGGIVPHHIELELLTETRTITVPAS